MNYEKIYPKKSLQQFVQFFWNFEGDFNAESVYSLLSVASVNPKLAFQYIPGMSLEKDGNLTDLFVSGFQSQTTAAYQMVAKQKVGVFGVYFQPYTIPFLFDIPSEEIVDQNIAIADLLGVEGRQLEDQMMTCKDQAERVALISDYLENKLRSNALKVDRITKAIDDIRLQKGNLTIPTLLDNQFLSQRQFERNFKMLTGYSPKYFSRIIRFEHCIEQAYGSEVSLTELALTSGYFDQAHMIRDFKEFTGKKPSTYLAEDLSLFFNV